MGSTSAFRAPHPPQRLFYTQACLVFFLNRLNKMIALLSCDRPESSADLGASADSSVKAFFTFNSKDFLADVPTLPVSALFFSLSAFYGHLLFYLVLDERPGSSSVLSPIVCVIVWLFFFPPSLPDSTVYRSSGTCPFLLRPCFWAFLLPPFLWSGVSAFGPRPLSSASGFSLVPERTPAAHLF